VRRASLVHDVLIALTARTIGATLVTPRAGEVNRKVMARLKKAGIPTVLLDRRPDELGARDRCDLVSIDNPRAGYLAAFA